MQKNPGGKEGFNFQKNVKYGAFLHNINWTIDNYNNQVKNYINFLTSKINTHFLFPIKYIFRYYFNNFYSKNTLFRKVFSSDIEDMNTWSIDKKFRENFQIQCSMKKFEDFSLSIQFHIFLLHLL